MKPKGFNLVQAEKNAIARECKENERRYGKFFVKKAYADVSGYGACSYGSCNDACTGGDQRWLKSAGENPILDFPLFFCASLSKRKEHLK